MKPLEPMKTTFNSFGKEPTVEELKAALKEAIDWLDQAPFDYRNGNEAQGVDEGEVLGWKAHKTMVNKFKRLLGIPVSELDEFAENYGTKLPKDDFPF